MINRQWMLKEIPKDVENGQFFNKSASSCARVASYPPTSMPFGGPVIPAARRCWSRVDRKTGCRVIKAALHPCRAHFDVFLYFSSTFSHVEATGKLRFFQRKPRATQATLQLETWHCTRPQRHLAGVQISAPYLQPFDLHAKAIEPTAPCGQTDWSCSNSNLKDKILYCYISNKTKL